MKTRYLLFALICLALMIGLAVSERVETLPAIETMKGWETDYVRGLKTARETGKMILLDFTGSDWCPECIQLQKDVFSRPEFKAFAGEHLVLVKIDFPRRTPLPDVQRQQNEMLAGQYRIEGFPSVFVLNSAGERLADLTELKGGLEAYLAALNKLAKG